MGTLYYWIANWNLSRAQAAQLLGEAGESSVVDMIDCTGDALSACLQSSIRYLATYVTGSGGIAATAAQWLELEGLVHTDSLKYALPIDQSDNATLVLTGDRLLVKDTEPGASSPGSAAAVARARLAAGLDHIIYVDTAELPQVESAVAAEGLAPGRIGGYQYASPTSNPDLILPGTGQTLSSANADLSVMDAALFVGITPHGPPGSGSFAASLVQTDDRGWHVQGVSSKSAVLGGPDVWQEVKVGVNRRHGLWRASPLPIEER